MLGEKKNNRELRATTSETTYDPRIRNGPATLGPRLLITLAFSSDRLRVFLKRPQLIRINYSSLDFLFKNKEIRVLGAGALG